MIRRVAQGTTSARWRDAVRLPMRRRSSWPPGARWCSPLGCSACGPRCCSMHRPGRTARARLDERQSSRSTTLAVAPPLIVAVVGLGVLVARRLPARPAASTVTGWIVRRRAAGRDRVPASRSPTTRAARSASRPVAVSRRRPAPTSPTSSPSPSRSWCSLGALVVVLLSLDTVRESRLPGGGVLLPAAHVGVRRRDARREPRPADPCRGAGGRVAAGVRAGRTARATTAAPARRR